jgi:hypothetical protein
MNTLLKTALCTASLQATVATAAEPQSSTPATAQQITRAGTQPSVVGPTEYFTGRKHWHGATPITPMTHLAVIGTVGSKSVT